MENFAVLSLVYFIIFIGDGYAEITMKVIPGESNFVEDKPTTFSCHVSGATHGDHVICTIRDPNTKQKIFYTYSIRDESPPMKLDNRNETEFRLIMRRDFSRMEIVCRTTVGKQNASLKLRQIKKTIPIDEVEFTSTHLVHGQPLLLRCDVWAHPAVVKLVDFRGTHSMELANNHSKIGPEHLRYELSFPQYSIDVENHDGRWMQCIASKDGFKKPTGNVVSRSKRMVVHYFKSVGPKSTKQTVPKGSLTSTSFNVSCNPAPEKDQFVVTRANQSVADGNETIPLKNITIEKTSGKYEYRVIVGFLPEAAASYHIDFETEFLPKTRAVTVNIEFAEECYFNCQSNKKGDLSADSEFEQKIPLLFLPIGCTVGLLILPLALITVCYKRTKKTNLQSKDEKGSQQSTNPLLINKEKETNEEV